MITATFTNGAKGISSFAFIFFLNNCVIPYTADIRSESIIMGKVPEVYLQGGGLGKSLNLVP